VIQDRSEKQKRSHTDADQTSSQHLFAHEVNRALVVETPSKQRCSFFELQNKLLALIPNRCGPVLLTLFTHLILPLEHRAA
jgi:hypothetical protein